MIFRRFIAWLFLRLTTTCRVRSEAFGGSGLDHEEFARLLKSRNPDDLKKIARAMSKPDTRV